MFKKSQCSENKDWEHFQNLALVEFLKIHFIWFIWNFHEILFLWDPVHLIRQKFIFDKEKYNIKIVFYSIHFGYFKNSKSTYKASYESFSASLAFQLIYFKLQSENKAKWVMTVTDYQSGNSCGSLTPSRFYQIPVDWTTRVQKFECVRFWTTDLHFDAQEYSF